MKLNRFEKVIVASGIRSWFETHIELPRLIALHPLPDNAHVLEIGCGYGHGLSYILRQPQVSTASAFDLDTNMVTATQKTLNRHSQHAARLWQGNANEINADDNFFDAVFNIAVLHHVGNWQSALKEVHRVLKPGGIFYAEEYYRQLICNFLVNKIVSHPQENRFSHEEFIQELKRQGFEITGSKSLGGLIGLCTARKI